MKYLAKIVLIELFTAGGCSACPDRNERRQHSEHTHVLAIPAVMPPKRWKVGSMEHQVFKNIAVGMEFFYSWKQNVQGMLQTLFGHVK